MTVLSKLPKLVSKTKKRRGKGYGSGKGGHTSGRGQKGAKSRGKVSIIATGTKHKKSLWQRLPSLRGKKRGLTQKKKILAINLDRLIPYIKQANEKINLEFLLANKIIKKNEKREIKIVLGKLVPKHFLNFELKVSQGVAKLNDSLKSKKTTKVQKTKTKEAEK